MTQYHNDAASRDTARHNDAALQTVNPLASSSMTWSVTTSAPVPRYPAMQYGEMFRQPAAPGTPAWMRSALYPYADPLQCTSVGPAPNP